MRGVSAAILWLACSTFAQGPGPGGMHGRMMGQLPPVMESAANPLSDAKIDLGRMLFYDPRLSQGKDVSCNSCHDLARYGVDGEPVSTGHRGQKGNRNSPTVYHAAGHIAQFWDGRAPTVEEQAKGPVLNPVEMGMASAADVEKTLRAIPGYVAAFRRAFPGSAEPVTFDNAAIAIGAFERKLVTPSRWDRFLAGDNSALNSEEFAGHHEFMHGGCATCHNGPYVGGRMFQKLGAERPWPRSGDLGRFSVTKQESDRMVFKVPSLRNVAQTGPYFHDGQVAQLADAVRLMGEHQLNTRLSDAQVNRIVAWLQTLTGELPRAYIQPPALPR
jgi:cytochrome c peroxidase